MFDQPILIVGAMVLGPEFGPVAASCFGLLRRTRLLIGAAVRALVLIAGRAEFSPSGD